jgi:hypothetical protein
MNTTVSDSTRLDSTTLADAAYDDRHHQLRLDFRDGSRYLYSGVAPDLYRALLSATSKGSFFNRYIRGHFHHAKLPHEN